MNKVSGNLLMEECEGAGGVGSSRCAAHKLVDGGGATKNFIYVLWVSAVGKVSVCSGAGVPRAFCE